MIQLPHTQRGYDTLVMFVDRLSKRVCIRACTGSINARELAYPFKEAVFSNHGVPDTIITDRDSKFTSAF
jgi:hypothetical protein